MNRTDQHPQDRRWVIVDNGNDLTAPISLHSDAVLALSEARRTNPTAEAVEMREVAQ